MFCDGCGTALQPNQAYCSSCGKEVRGGVHIGAPRPGRVQEHIRLVGILWLAVSAFNAIGGAVMLILANTIFRSGSGWGGPPPGPRDFMHFLMTFLAVLVFVKAAAGFAAGWGLLQRESWARILALIVAFISLFNVPIGTALGIYTLWVLLPTQSDQEYQLHVKAA